MAVKVEYILNAEKADKELDLLRHKANEQYEKKLEKLLAYRDGYIEAIMDVQDKLIHYQLTEKQELEQ